MPGSVLTLLTALDTKPLPRAKLLDALGLTDQYTNAVQHIKPLIDAGLVEMTEPNKPRTNTQRYRITVAGLTWLSVPKS